VDAETLELLRTSLRHVLADGAGRPLTDRLDDLGWAEVVADDEPTAVRTLFEVKGDTLSPADALGPRVAGVLARELVSPEIASATVVLPPSLHPAALPQHPGNGSGALEVHGIALSRAGRGAAFVVPARDTSGGVRVGLARGGLLFWDELDGMDPDAPLARVDGSAGADKVTWFTGDDAHSAWEEAVAAAQWALAAELVGAGRHVLARVVEYAGARHQYGRPIGSFQAVQHRLASAHASLVGAAAVVAEAATTGSPWAARVAKALAGRAAEDACTQAQQVYGAIGFTWEHEFHRYLRRVYVLDRLFGDWRTLEFEIGTELQETTTVPRIGAI
jgi:hypothetical protein